MKGRELLRRCIVLGVMVEPARGKDGHYLLRNSGKKASLPGHGDVDFGPEGITQKQVSEKTGIPTRHISEMDNRKPRLQSHGRAER